MAIRTVCGGGTTVRWVHGVFIALCAALAVLVHHDTAAMDTSAMSGMPASSMTGAAHAGHVMAHEGNPASWGTSSPNTVDTGGCSASGMQHCSTASVDTVQLAVPDEHTFIPFADLLQAVGGCTPTGAVGRAPPDLSVLSQLRI